MAGSWSSATYDTIVYGSPFKTISYTFTADSSDGSVPDLTFDSTAVTFVKGYYLVVLETDPGSTAPTDNWGVTITNSAGVDILGGAGLNRDSVNSEWAIPSIVAAPIYGSLTISVSGNSVASATATITLIVAR